MRAYSGTHKVPQVRQGLCALILWGMVCTGSVTLLAQGATCLPAPSGLAGWWPADGNSKDLVQGQDGVFQGDYVATGIIGGAFGFDGSTSSLAVPAWADVRPPEFSIECWVWFDNLDSATNGGAPVGQQFIAFKQNTGTNAAFSLQKVRTPDGDVFSFTVSASDAEPVAILSTNRITTGVWYHLAGLRGPDYIQLYVNGSLASQTNVSFAQSYGDSRLYFGTTGQAAWDGKLHGKLDEISIYTRALEPEEIQQIFVTGAAGKCKQVEITSQPLDQTVIAGAEALFSVSATGLAPLSYIWRLNGTPLPGATAVYLSLAKVQQADEGDYDVIISNNVNSVTSSVARLTVSTPPAIVAGPESQTYVVGETLLLSCQATGTIPLQYQWYFGRNPIAAATTSTLEITSAHATNAGDYSVRISNAAGAVTSSVATLTLFDDSQLHAAVRASLRKSGTTGPVTIERMRSLPRLWGNEFEITSLRMLTNATLLKEAWLGRNNITDLTPLAQLNGIERLHLAQNRITNVEPIAALSNLTELNLANNPVQDVLSLSALSNLISLDLHSTSITNLTFLMNLKFLKSFSAFETGIADVSPLLDVPELLSLDLRWNALTNAPSLGNLVNLRSLHLGATGLTNCVFLQYLTNLTLLNLAENRIQTISSLTNLPRLQYLALSGNPITDYSPLSKMGSLENLELRGNGLTDVSFLSSLPSLRYVDLAKNKLSDVSPLGVLPDLTLVLDENPQFITQTLTNFTNLKRVWLNGNAVTDLSFVYKNPGLIALGIDGAKIKDILPVKNLPQLEHLSLSRCAVTNLAVISQLTNLQALRLEGSLLSDAWSVLSGLTKLEFLSLADNRLRDPSSLNSLTNLTSLYLNQNRLTDITLLTSFPELSFLNVGRNLLDLTPGSASQNTIAQLRQTLTEVTFAPTNELHRVAASVPAANKWYIPADENSGATFKIFHDLLGQDEFQISTNQNPWSLTTNWFDTDAGVWRFLVQPDKGLVATGTISFDAVLSIITTQPGGFKEVRTDIQIDIRFPTNLVMDPNLENVLVLAAGKSTGPITTVDMLNLTELMAYSAGLSTISGLEYASNLTRAYLSGNTLRDLSPLQKVDRLNTLTLDRNMIEDVSPLTTLYNLTYLDLSWNPITNHSVLAGLTNLSVLRLEHCGLTNITFLTNLVQLVSLSIADNKLTDISAVAALTNLTSLYFHQNRLVEVPPLMMLNQLRVVDARFNLLTASSNPVFQWLRNNECIVFDFPQRTPPLIDVRTNWIVPVGVTSSLPVAMLDSGPIDERLGVGATGIPESFAFQFERANDPDNDIFWLLSMTNSPDTSFPATILLSATNDVGLFAQKSVEVFSTDLRLEDGLDTNFTWSSWGNASWIGQAFTPRTTPTPTAQSGAIGNGQHSLLQTTLEGPGKVTFWWKVSSETNADYLEFLITNYSIRISGEVDWQQRAVNVPEGPQTITWRYSKNGAISSGKDAGWLDGVVFESGTNPPVITTHLQDQIADVGGNATFTVESAGPEPLYYQWYFQGTNLLTSAFSSTLTVLDATDAKAGFYSVVVSNGYSANSVAKLTINHYPVPPTPVLNRYASYGVKLRGDPFIGTDPDGDAVILLQAGPGTLFGGSARLLGGWICYAPPISDPWTDSFPFSIGDDRVSSIGTAWVATLAGSPPPPVLTQIPMPDNTGIRLLFDAVPYRSYRLEYSMGYSDWQPLAVVKADKFGVGSFVDPVPSGVPQRSYRLVTE